MCLGRLPFTFNSIPTSGPFLSWIHPCLAQLRTDAQEPGRVYGQMTLKRSVLQTKTEDQSEGTPQLREQQSIQGQA